MIAFDSNILIYILEKNSEFFDKAIAVFTEIEQVGGVCSSLVVTESLKGTIRSFSMLYPLHNHMIQIITLDIRTAELAGEIRMKYGLKTPDSIHIATALLSDANIFITNDHKLIKIKIPGLNIRGLYEQPIDDLSGIETTSLDEKSLSDWDDPEEAEAWAHLQ